jgi:hypothetical protein
MVDAHPYIGILCFFGKSIIDEIKIGSYGSALDTIQLVLHTMDQDARDKDSWIALDQDVLNIIMDRQRLSERATDEALLVQDVGEFDLKNRQKYINLQSRMWLICWENKYLLNNTYGRPEPKRETFLDGINK